MRELAGSFDADRPGLPRGRAKLPPDEVGTAQRTRMLRAVVTAAAQSGIQVTTVADIVGRARVSRQAFYRQFDSKEACLIAAVDRGIHIILSTMETASRVADGLSPEEQLSLLVAAYLRKCDDESEFARAWALELPHAGHAGIAKRNDYLEALAVALRKTYASMAAEAVVPAPDVFLAAIGGCHELFYRHAFTGDSPYSELHSPMTSFLARVLYPAKYA